MQHPNAQRLWYIGDAFRLGMTAEEIYQLSGIDPWFLEKIREIVVTENEVQGWLAKAREVSRGTFTFLEARWALPTPVWLRLRTARKPRFGTSARKRGIEAVFSAVDTCGAEFAAFTPYLYSTYEGEDEARPTQRKKIMILGGGPNRIGQGIEFDYCCVHAAFALREEGYETIMVNCNPETVSTDYDTSDKLYFEPLTMEDVLNIVEREKPDGVIVQFGGQTPLKLALPLERAGVKIIGTSPDSIDLAEDRERFAELLHRLGIKQPENGIARSYRGGVQDRRRGSAIPILVRPSYVLGGRAMEIVYDRECPETLHDGHAAFGFAGASGFDRQIS